MYISRRKHILSGTIMLAALINLAESGLMALARLILGKSGTLTPDMLDEAIWNLQLLMSVAQILLTGGLFYLAWRRLMHYMGVVEEDDHQEMARLQEEMLGKKLSNLSAPEISKLLQIWAVIFVGSQLVYNVTSFIYRNFTGELTLMLAQGGGAGGESFLSIYNQTHGFKYMAMLIAILIGVMMTGIFLGDGLLKSLVIGIVVLFLLAFSVFRMNTLSIMGRDVGVVWTSVIFHLIETVGLIVFSLYLRVRYAGV